MVREIPLSRMYEMRLCLPAPNRHVPSVTMHRTLSRAFRHFWVAFQAIADVEKSKADLAANNARTIEVEAEMELAVAKPALMAAHEAVNCLDKASLTELKSFSKVLRQYAVGALSPVPQLIHGTPAFLYPRAP